MSDTDPTIAGDESYRLIRVLNEDRTFLCADAAENLVVLKRLDEDCLHRNQLHPSIRDRLAKIRELAHPRIAPLRGVERWKGQAFMVWVYLNGETFDDALTKPTADLSAMAAELLANTEALGRLGLVHGNLHGKNIIVRPDGRVWLTDFSPYLYTDPQVDIAAISLLLNEERLPRKVPSAAGTESQAINYRATSLVAAFICILLAVGFALIYPAVIGKSINRQPATFPSLR